MSTKTVLEDTQERAREIADDAMCRFWNTWDRTATGMQRNFLLRYGGMDQERDNETRTMSKPARRQEYRKLCRLYMEREMAKCGKQ